MSIEEIREAVKTLPRRSNGLIIRIPDTVRTEVLKQVDTLGGVAAVAEAVGISAITISGWQSKVLRKSRAKVKADHRFRRLDIIPKEKVSFVVEGPRGLRVIGLSISDIALLVKEVGS